MVRHLLQIRVEDHVSPLLKAISDAHFSRPIHLPPFPYNPVTIEHTTGLNDPFICMRPSRELLAWLSVVIGQGEQEASAPPVQCVCGLWPNQPCPHKNYCRL